MIKRRNLGSYRQHILPCSPKFSSKLCVCPFGFLNVTKTVGKNKCLTKGGRKGAKKKVADPFSKKHWYDVKTPAMFNTKKSRKALTKRTQGNKMASDGLKGCVFEMNLADPHNDEAAFGQSKLITEDVQGKTCLRFPWYGSYLLQNVLDGQKVADHD